MKNKVSIIVPVYNCDKYLNKCIDSILNQTYRNFELILINDGSTDESLEICKERSLEDNRIIVINKKNGGVSSARNEGLKIATGDYLLFIDGDDYIDIDCVQNCINIISEFNLDIVKFGYIKELRKKITKKYHYTVPVNEKIERKNYSNQLYPYILSTNDFCNVTNAIIKKSIVKNIVFQNDILIGEDYLFFVECLRNSNSIYFMDEFFYHYVVNNDSATHNFNEKSNVQKLANSLFVNEKIKNIVCNDNYNATNEYSLKCIDSIYNNIISCITNTKYNTFCTYIDTIQNDEFIKLKIKEISIDMSKNIKQLLNKNKRLFYTYKIKNILKRKIKVILAKL